MVRSSTLLIAGTLVLAGAAPASAQEDLAARLAVCAAISSSLERLDCYDGLAAAEPAPQVSAPNTGGIGTGSWLIEESIDPLTDRPSVSLAVTSTEPTTRFGDHTFLVIRCQNGETDVILSWNEFLGTDNPRITHRIGTQDADTRSWSISNSNQSAFYRGNEINFVVQLLSATRFVAQVTPYGEGRRTAIFDTTGLDQAVGPLQAACPWN